MATCRAIIAEAMRALKAVGVGDEPSVDELATGVEALQLLTLDIHEARGPMLDVDAGADLTPSENQRVRIQAGATIAVTLPNAIPVFSSPDPCDYGFPPSQGQGATSAPAGTTGAADGVQYRQPRDGTRIEIVGVTQALYFYRADINAWTAATGLTADAETPFNNRYSSALGALLAERLMEVLPGSNEPTQGLGRRIARGRAALMLRTGTARDPVAASYF